jgi:hypothetical protein
VTGAGQGRAALRRRPARQRADYWLERGATDALVQLFGSRRLRPEVTFAEAAEIAAALRVPCDDDRWGAS